MLTIFIIFACFPREKCGMPFRRENAGKIQTSDHGMFYRSLAEAPRTISGIKLLIDGGGLSPTTVRLHGVACHVGGATRWHVFRLAAAFSMFANTHFTYTHKEIHKY